MTADPIMISPDSPPPPPQNDRIGDAAELVAEDRFSIVPEWVLDSDIGDCALRLYAVLLRYGNTTGARMPARSTLAARLHKKSVDTVDRALAELVDLGAVQVEPRWAGRERLTNRYRIRTSRPTRNGPTSPAASGSGPGGGRTDAATRTDRVGGGRTGRGRVAARIGQYRECSTETPPPPPPPPAAPSARSAAGGGGGRSSTQECTRQPRGTGSGVSPVEHWRRRHEALLADCGVRGGQAWDDYVAQIRTARRNAGQPLTRWSPAHLLTALDLAVRGRGWPADRASDALRNVAADPHTRSPARVAEAGPWWDDTCDDAPGHDAEAAVVDLANLEAELDATNGKRVLLQQQARQQLARAKQPVTRRTVLQTAVHLLHTET